MKRPARESLFERLVLVEKHTVASPWPTVGDCWIWPGARCNKGYGQIKTGGVAKRVHIAAWELVKGRKVRRGYTLDHRCRNPACWRPSHVEEVTRAVNTARGNRANPRSTVAATAAAARKRRGIEVCIPKTKMVRDALKRARESIEKLKLLPNPFVVGGRTYFHTVPGLMHDPVQRITCSKCGGRFGPAFGPAAATCTCGD